MNIDRVSTRRIVHYNGRVSFGRNVSLLNIDDIVTIKGEGFISTLNPCNVVVNGKRFEGSASELIRLIERDIFSNGVKVEPKVVDREFKKPKPVPVPHEPNKADEVRKPKMTGTKPMIRAVEMTYIQVHNIIPLTAYGSTPRVKDEFEIVYSVDRKTALVIFGDQPRERLKMLNTFYKKRGRAIGERKLRNMLASDIYLKKT